MPTAYDFADENNELFTFGDRTFFDAIHGINEYAEFNPDGYVPNVHVLSSSIKKSDILAIPVFKAKLLAKTIVTTQENFEAFSSELADSEDFKAFCSE